MIADSNPLNNSASLILPVGEITLSDVVMNVTVGSASALPDSVIDITGRAGYDFDTVPGTFDFPVQGGIVKLSLAGKQYSAHTLTDGSFDFTILAPHTPGTYPIGAGVTDTTISGAGVGTLMVLDDPDAVINEGDGESLEGGGDGGGGVEGGGTGQNSGDEGGGDDQEEIDDTPETEGPQDVSVFSEDIGFSKFGPAVGETITVFALINWSGNGPEFGVPVIFNDIEPINGSLVTTEIGATTVDFFSATDVEVASVPWTNNQAGAQIIQVVVDPAFTQFTGNDAATRLFFVGQGRNGLTASISAKLATDSDNNGAFSPGDTVGLTLDVSNNGSIEQTGGKATFLVDTTKYGAPVSISDGGSYDDGQVIWDLDDLAPGHTKSLTLELPILSADQFPPGPTIITNNLTVSTDEFPTIASSLEIRVNPYQIVVTDSGDFVAPQSSVTTLRQAILDANDWKGSQLITFASLLQTQDGSPVKFAIFSPLPEITDTVTIDGTMQSGFTPLIELDGSAAGSGAAGLVLDDVVASKVRGLIITKFSGNGIEVVGGGKNEITDDLIGTDSQGDPLGNAGNGISISDSQGDVIGGVDSDMADTIAFNGDEGVAVAVESSLGVAIRGNSIYSNGGLGIDLGNNGVTLNDALDADSGPNTLLNFPTLIAARPGSSTHVVGSYSGAADTAVIMDIYASGASDPSGFGEGQKYLGSFSLTTDDSGNASFELDVPGTSARRLDFGDGQRRGRRHIRVLLYGGRG